MHPFEQHPTIFGIICVAAAVFVLQVSGAYSTMLEYSVIPLEVEHAWTALLNGDAGTSTLRVLLTMVTGLFLHGGPPHLIMNMVFLWMFGSLTSQYLGKWWALGLFFVCGVGGFVLHVVLNQGSSIPCIGASGAVTGFEGIYLGLALQWRLSWPDVWPLARPVPPMQLGLFAIAGIGMDLWGLTQQGQDVAFGAHIGGFVTGLIIAGTITQFYPSLQRWEQSSRGRA
ncbi:MAG: rhomboid family intramembrane serine protease [Fuerstiella sp.]